MCGITGAHLSFSATVPSVLSTGFIFCLLMTAILIGMAYYILVALTWLQTKIVNICWNEFRISVWWNLFPGSSNGKQGLIQFRYGMGVPSIDSSIGSSLNYCGSIGLWSLNQWSQSRGLGNGTTP